MGECQPQRSGANLLLPQVTKLRQGNIFTGVCHSVHRGGDGWQGGMCGGGHVWVCGRGRLAWQGVCMVGEACVAGGHVW